jgi:hypothetical protein
MSTKPNQQDDKINSFIDRNNEKIKTLAEKLKRKKTIRLEDAKPIIFLFYLISESFGRSCAVFLIQLANYLDNPIVLFRLQNFQPQAAGRGIIKNSPKYLLNFVILRDLLRKKKILRTRHVDNVEILKEEREVLIRYISDNLEDKNFLRGYVVIRYIKNNDRMLLEILKTILLKTVDAGGEHLFSESDIVPYFEQQEAEEPINDIADSHTMRDMREELCSSSGFQQLEVCCNQFNLVWDAVLLRLAGQ